MNVAKISMWQAAILLFLTRIFSVLNYIPALNVQVEGMAILIGTVISFLIQLLIMIPIFILYSRFEGMNILDIAFLKSKVFGTVMTILYIFMLLFSFIQSTFEFSFFVVNAVYPNTSIMLIIVTMSLVCLYCTKNGIEGIARVGSIVFVFFILSILFICIVSFTSVHLLNLTPIMNNPVMSVTKFTFWHTANSPELLIFALILPKIRKKIKSAGIWYLILSFIFTMLINFLILSVLGEFGFIQTFPAYTLTSVLEMPILQRLDSLYMFIWVFLSFIRITLLSIMIRQCLRKVLPYRVSKVFPTLIFTVAIILSSLIVQNIEIYKNITYIAYVVYFCFMVCFPLLLTFITKKKKGDQDEKNKSLSSSSDDSFIIDTNGLY